MNRAEWKADDSAWRRWRRDWRAKGCPTPGFPPVPFRRPQSAWRQKWHEYATARGNLLGVMLQPVGLVAEWPHRLNASKARFGGPCCFINQIGLQRLSGKRWKLRN